MVFLLLSKKPVPASEPFVEETGPVFVPVTTAPVISGPAAAPYVEPSGYYMPEPGKQLLVADYPPGAPNEPGAPNKMIPL